jgi:transcriptional regulator with XRE-family HTH domain
MNKTSVNNSYIELGEIIREYREKKGMTQLDLARKLDYSTPQFVSLFERGLSKVPMETLGFLIKVLGIPEKKIVYALVSSYKEELEDQIKRGKRKASC